MTRHFEKYEGLGNDFLVVEDAGPIGRAAAQALCDRHFGVGADGVLTVAPGATPGARAAMIVENADGSRPEMCGNGLRCVALHLARKDGLDRAEYLLDTDAGPRVARVDREGDSAEVTIDMGRASVTGEQVAQLDGRELRFTRISVGNPHAIHIGPIPALAEIDRIGPWLSADTPGGTNVEFVQRVGPDAYDLVVWERGVGRTLACGTGAVATGAALCLAGLARYEEPLEIRLPGGPLRVWVAEGSLALRFRGPARRVFSGELA